MTKDFDCVLCGSCVADMLVKPVPLTAPIGPGRLFQTDPVEVVTGGIVCNSGIALARLGMKPAAFSYVGRDDWGLLIRRRLEAERVDCGRLLTHPTAATSTTAALIDQDGQRSFAARDSRLVGLRDLARSESERGESRMDFALRFGRQRRRPDVSDSTESQDEP